MPMTSRELMELKTKQAALVRQWTAATKTGRVREGKEAMAALLVVAYQLKGAK